ncbi:MAG: peptidoglycan-binding protein LysM [Paracoccus sp. (in: a-proteobacteria)]|uniref:peptidoglycan-binding protein LysM n=1 Tax=Paracoccus sp. TaxID=267 RepID=UPI0026E0CDF5|nr:peptidoglycan-binding protein LysM [Paracoccus sp. (in: a-proteobacteria)]MDO5622273.1 peptidoglycan-binding protein LysM [Paracoccus sp. (in: a-proteobacteria)]
MAFWDFIKGAGKKVLPGEAAAATPAADPTEAAKAEEKRKVDALVAELKELGLNNGDVHVTLRGDVVIVTAKDIEQETLEKLILAVGNIEGIARVELKDERAAAPAGADAPNFYTVQKGDTLSAIAQKTLGSAGRYNEIFEANRPMLSSPDKIYPGQTLRIPAK